MIHVDTLRRLLALADVARDPYTVASAAGDLLIANPADTIAATHYLRALVALQLHQAARALPHAELQETIARLPAAPSGVIPWNSRARRFRANVAALAQRNAAAAERVTQAATTLEHYALHQSADGNYHLQDLRAPHVWAGWIGGLGDHKNVDHLWPFDKTKTPVPPPLAFDGAGFGWLLLRILSITENSFLTYSCATYLLESDPAALAILLHLHDLQEILSGPRLRVFVGTEASEVLADFHKKLTDNFTWSVPQQVITQPLLPRPAMSVQKEMEDLLTQRAATRDHLLRQIDLHYAGRDHQAWHRRFVETQTPGPSPLTPLRVLGITTRYSTVLQHSVREMRDAVLAAGHDMQLAIEPDDQSVENPFVEMIAEYKPDLIFQVSRLRYENPHIPKRVPFLAWDQDNLPSMRADAATASLDRLTYVAGHAAFHGYVYLGWPRRNCIMCQPAAATHRYTPRALSPDEKSRFSCDLSYVSNASGSAAELRDQLAPHWRANADAEAIFRSLTDAVLAGADAGENWNSSRLHGLLLELQKRRGVELMPRAADEMIMAAVTVADRAFRHAVLTWAADLADNRGYALRLYGLGWEAHPRFAKFAAGPARQGEELRAIFQATKINLQIIETGFIHSRALDGLAAGGFFLTRRTDYDGLDPAPVLARHNLSLYIRANGIQKIEQLETASDPKVREWWKLVRNGLLEQPGGGVFRPEDFMRGLEVSAETPAASIIFPQFEQIAFTDRAGFSAHAERFLGDDTLRQSIATQMRQVVLDHFSYDARWKQFLAGVTAGLAD